MITALLIDDEEHNRNVLRTLLKTHCPYIDLIGEASNAVSAFEQINSIKPQLVFLDIKMPKKSGFDLLKQFTEINFEVIFVTAFNKYAIKAFEFNAVGYIVKPIDNSKLVKAVEKATERIRSYSQNNIILHFVKTLSDKNELINKFSLHHNGKVVFLNIPEIAFIESHEDHTTITLLDNTHYYSSKDLRQFEYVLEEAGNFTRVNKSVIVNTHCIKSYSKGELCVIDLKSGQAFEVSRRRKAEILKKLKAIG